MIWTITEIALSATWWTGKKLVNGIYYVIYGTPETKEEKDMKKILEELNDLKSEIASLKPISNSNN